MRDFSTVSSSLILEALLSIIENEDFEEACRMAIENQMIDSVKDQKDLPALFSFLFKIDDVEILKDASFQN